MIEYFILALSFSLSSLRFIHMKAIKDQGIEDYDILYDVAYVVVCLVLFPIILVGWLYNSERYVKDYGIGIAEVLERGKD